MTVPALTLVVIRVSDLDRSRRFYEALGLSFRRERHGKGPEHLAAEPAGAVFELYPQGNAGGTAGVRIGFRVESVAAAVSAVAALGAEVLTPPADSPWGRQAVVADPDGHRVEVTELPGRGQQA